MAIKIPSNFMGKPIEGALERVLAKAEAGREEQPPAGEGLPSDARVRTTQDLWRIEGVNYRNGVYTVDLAKSLLDSGNAKTQEDWAKYYESVRGKSAFYTPDYPLLYGLVKALYTARDNSSSKSEVVAAHDFLKDNARAKWLMPLTRILYKPRGTDDIIVHNYVPRGN